MLLSGIHFLFFSLCSFYINTTINKCERNHTHMFLWREKQMHTNKTYMHTVSRLSWLCMTSPNTSKMPTRNAQRSDVDQMHWAQLRDTHMHTRTYKTVYRLATHMSYTCTLYFNLFIRYSKFKPIRSKVWQSTSLWRLRCKDTHLYCTQTHVNMCST